MDDDHECAKCGSALDWDECLGCEESGTNCPDCHGAGGWWVCWECQKQTHERLANDHKPTPAEGGGGQRDSPAG